MALFSRFAAATLGVWSVLPLAGAVFTLSGDFLPDAAVVEGSNAGTNASQLTTIVFSGTGWSVDDGSIKMTTGPGRGIWFGTSQSGYGDNSGFLPSGSAAGNRLEMTSRLSIGAQSWGFYFFDLDGYYASVQFNQTDNGQNAPGVWVSFEEGGAQVSGDGFDLSVLHTFEAHLYEGTVTYSVDGQVVGAGPASQSGRGGLTVIGDGSGGTPTGTGSMWIDSLVYDNAAGAPAITLIPEPSSLVLFASLLAGLGGAVRRRR